MKKKKRGVRPPIKSWSRRWASRLKGHREAHRAPDGDVLAPTALKLTPMSFNDLCDAFYGTPAPKPEPINLPLAPEPEPINLPLLPMMPIRPGIAA